MTELQLITVADFIWFARIGRTTFDSYVKAGEIRIVKRGRRTAAFPNGRMTRVPIGELVRFFRECHGPEAASRLPAGSPPDLARVLVQALSV